MPLLELTLEDSGYNCNCASCDAYRKVEYEVYSIYGECLATDNCTQVKDKSGVDDVCANDVTNRKRVFLLADSR